MKRAAFMWGLALAACPGELPAGELAAFLDHPPPCDAPNQVFVPRCGQCHVPGPQQQGGLDLISAGVEARLINQPSSACSAETLVVPGYPDASYLMFKLVETPPPCGVQMPLGGQQLSSVDLACVGSWIGGLSADGG